MGYGVLSPERFVPASETVLTPVARQATASKPVEAMR
jgi:hypothetical protein